jgi:glyoxylase-like metal-dependent hydrolase (beta-lactamase superfamily II)
MIEVIPLVLGLVETNAYLVADKESQEAAVIDPAWDGQVIVNEAHRRDWKIQSIWLTHAHFDHIGGTAAIVKGVIPPPKVYIHPEDLPLWRMQGGAPFFGFQIDPGPEPGEKLFHGQILRLGSYEFQVRHTPGHTRGHVILYCQKETIAFCGDVIFMGSIGRTDLPGGDYSILMSSIQTQILSLPDYTRLLSGHGPETTVGIERKLNPFLI